MAAKRLKVEDGEPQAHAEAALATVLQRLQGLLSSGGEPEGLDALLEELGWVQAGLNGSGRADGAFKSIDHAQEKLQVRRWQRQWR